MALTASNIATCSMASARACSGGRSFCSAARLSARAVQSAMVFARVSARADAELSANAAQQARIIVVLMGSPFSMVAVRHSNPAAQSRGNAEKWAKPSRNLPNGAALRYFSAMSSSVRVVLIALFLHAMPVGAVEPAALAIRGYDPVAYFTDQRATPGIAAHEYVWDEHVWRFV